MKRRNFVKRAALAGAMGFSLQHFPHHLFAGTQKKYAHDIIPLGNTGLNVTRLAMGTGTHGVGGRSNQTRKLGIRGLADMLHYAYDNGIMFWDSADQYGTHPHLKEALKRVPREKVTILTKTHATTEKQMRDDLDRFRRELDTDYLDIMLLHCMMSGDWPEYKKPAMEVLARAREDGIIRTHGVSCHTLSALKAAAASDWVQVDLVRYNPAGVSMDADVNTITKILQQMKKDGKGIIGMKVLGAGRLQNKTDECLQFTLAKDFVDCFTIGQENVEEFNDLIKRIPEASVRG
ncbi:MAG: aldo/keto reductase [Bacteroidota bacterium]